MSTVKSEITTDSSNLQPCEVFQLRKPCRNTRPLVQDIVAAKPKKIFIPV